MSAKRTIPEPSQAKPKLKLDGSFTRQRKDSMKRNRAPKEKEYLEEYLARYRVAAVRAFRLGFLCVSEISNKANELERRERDWRREERMERFDALQRLTKQQRRKA